MQAQDSTLRTEPVLRRAEIVAALSVATDLGTGHPIERSLRSCLLAVEFGRLLGLPAAQLAEIFYVALLRWSGCTADSQRAELFGDEIALGPQIDMVELWNPGAMLGFLAQTIGAGEPFAQRAGKLAYALATGIKRSEVAAVAHCEVAQNIAVRIGLDAGVQDALGQIFERWDGRGVPGQARGEDIALSTRIVQIAMDAELFYRQGGVEGVQQLLHKRAGGSYDPELCERFGRAARQLFRLIEVASVWETTLASEPGVQIVLSADQIDAALHAVADFTDLRSPWLHGHSPAVAALAENAAQRMGLPEADILLTRRAGLVHDVGMAGVPLLLCERPGPLSDGDWERLRLHPYYTERILARPRALAPIGAAAALHHERMDGSGYHRGAPSGFLTPVARILAAADVYRALIEARPHRPAFTPEAAAAELCREAETRRLDADAVRAVLAAAGQRTSGIRPTNIAGLTAREIEVLRLLARGLSNRRMAQTLVISERTVDHHIRHIYAKIGVSTRAGATLFAMQHRLVDGSEEPGTEN